MAMLRRQSDKAAALSTIPLFSSLSKKELTEVAKHSDEIPVKAGTELMKQDAAGNAFYLIVAGKAVVRRNGRKIADLDEGDFAGELALIDGGPRTATVVMTVDGSVLEIHRREFASLLDRMPSISHKLLIGVAERLREADRRLVG